MVEDKDELISKTVPFEPSVPERITDEDVLVALEALPQHFKEIVVLSDVEGFAYKEIAGILDVPIGDGYVETAPRQKDVEVGIDGLRKRIWYWRKRRYIRPICSRRRITMNCTEFREVVDSYLSDELLTETNHSMMKHVESCEECSSLIEARKEIRSRLKFAVRNDEKYKLPDGFDHMMMTRIRTEAHQEEKSGSWFGFGSLATSFAALALVVSFGYFYFGGAEQKADAPYLVSGVSADSLVNIAAGDHRYCAN